MTDPLLPCPFCADRAEIVVAEEAGPSAHVVQCGNDTCMASSAVVFALKEPVEQKLTDRWNRRAVDADAHYETGFRDALNQAARLAWEFDSFHHKTAEALAAAIRAIPFPDTGREAAE